MSVYIIVSRWTPKFWVGHFALEKHDSSTVFTRDTKLLVARTQEWHKGGLFST